MYSERPNLRLRVRLARYIGILCAVQVVVILLLSTIHKSTQRFCTNVNRVTVLTVNSSRTQCGRLLSTLMRTAANHAECTVTVHTGTVTVHSDSRCIVPTPGKSMMRSRPHLWTVTVHTVCTTAVPLEMFYRDTSMRV